MTETAVVTDADQPEPETPFRWRLNHRPDLRFGHAAGGVAGILVAAAILSFVAEVADDDATLPGVGFTVLLIAAAIAAGYVVRGPVRSAAVAAIVLAVPAFWLFAVVGDGEGFDRGDFRIILLLSVATYAVLYALTWTRGRAILLGVALLLLTSWIVFEVSDQPTPFAAFPVNDVPVGFAQELGGADDNLTETGAAELILAVVLLGGAVILDRRGRAGAATPLLVVGGLQAVNAAGVLGVDSDDVYLAGLFVAIAGIAIGLAGTLGRRRGTSWVGAAVLLVGALIVVFKGTDDAVSDNGQEAVFGAFALIAAAVLLLIGVLVARAAHEPLDGGEPMVVEPPAPEPEPEPALVGATAAPTATAADADTAESPAAEPPGEDAAADTPAPETTTEPPPSEETPSGETASGETPGGETPGDETREDPWSRPPPDA